MDRKIYMGERGRAVIKTAADPDLWTGDGFLTTKIVMFSIGVLGPGGYAMPHFCCLPQTFREDHETHDVGPS
jgi:hypothetical protein